MFQDHRQERSGLGFRRVTEPEKELRFTRTHQATQFLILTAILITISLGIFSSMYSKWGPNDPDFYKYVWLCLIPLPIAAVVMKVAIHCIRHAYILLSPLGVEIFPFFKPEKNLQVIFWAEIHGVDFSSATTRMTIHTDSDHTSGIVATLTPISPAQRQLLKAALDNRLASVNDR